MSFNSNTFKQASSLGSIDEFFQDAHGATLKRRELVLDYVRGHDRRNWRDRFFLLQGHVGQWGDELFNCLHLLHPEHDRESFHTAFSHGMAEACFRRHQNKYLIFAAGLKSWETLSSRHLLDPETPEEMTGRIFERMNTHPTYAPADLEFMLLPAAYEHREIRLEEDNLNFKPLLDKLIRDPDLFDAILGRSKGARFKWAVQNVPQTALKSYFERHPNSPLLAERLEIEVGL